MYDLFAPSKGREITDYRPEETKVRQSQFKAIIATAAALQKWQELDEAVDAMIAEQRRFVEWWLTHVRRPGGDQRKSISVRSALMLAARATALTGFRHDQVSRWKTHLADLIAYRERMIIAARREAELSSRHTRVSPNSGEYEWYTPIEYIEAARAVLEVIDLDPASHEKAQEWIQASGYYTKEDDGLQQEWHGRVWLNPPYAQPDISNFVKKLVNEISAGRVSEAIMLTNNCTDTEWFHEAERHAALICFTRGRIQFVDQSGNEASSPVQGQSFFYYGDKTTSFVRYFGRFGFVR